MERDDGKGLERGAVPSQTNMFQGRYIIRHHWAGKVTCKRPNWGIWGGPPEAIAAKREAQAALAATKLGLVKNRRLALDRFVLERVPELRLRPSKPKAEKPPAEAPPGNKKSITPKVEAE